MKIGHKLVLGFGMLVASLALGGCATGGNAAEMVAQKTPVAPFPAPLNQAMCVRSVTGGEKTNPLWASKVSNEDFQAALSDSLAKVGLKSATPESCKYNVDANLLGLTQPAFGFDMTVTSHVNYKVYDQKSVPLVLETVEAAHTSTMSDAFVGTTRLRMANEGSIRENISKFLDKLQTLKP